MSKLSDDLLERFISGKRISQQEFPLLESLLENAENKQYIFQWMEDKWHLSTPEMVALQFDQLRKKIRNKSARQRVKNLISILSKAAAILYIPLFVAALYLYLNKTDSDKLLTLSTQKGEQTSVILPDGSMAWLNVDTKLRYPVNYGVKSRKIELEGQAYFEVMKNKELPFEVLSGTMITRALGTKFVVSSYSGASAVKSSLIEGSVEIECGKATRILTSGQQFIYNREKSEISIQPFNEADELAWKNEQLIFRLTPYNQVIKELEKWYDVSFNYNPDIFESETFSAKFKRYETLENVLQIMSKAGKFDYRIDGKVVKILVK
jgi:ferric-dicitrate binding protein FerR (iron transport regulator)